MRLLDDEVVTKLEEYRYRKQSKGKSMVVLSIRSTARCRIRRTFEEIYDLIAIRCILDNVMSMLSWVMHELKPMPGRLKTIRQSKKATVTSSSIQCLRAKRADYSDSTRS